jgi:lysozyme
MGRAGYRRWQFGTEFTPEDGAPWTIGYGSTFDDTGRPVKPGEMWSHDKAVYVKGIVTNSFLQKLIALSPGLITEPTPRIAAVLSWVYNCGLGSYRISTFKKRIDSKDWYGAAEECKKWDKAKGIKLKGLTRRRNLESLHIING